MRAGKLDRTIIIERVANGTSTSGAVVETWSTLATLRAELLQITLDEAQRQNGANTDRILIFRTRYFAGITVADRVSYGSAAYNITKITEIGRRKEIELRCEWVGP